MLSKLKNLGSLSLAKVAGTAGAVAGFLTMAVASHAAVPVADPTAAAGLTDVTTGIANTYFGAWVAVLLVIGAIIVTGLFIRFVLSKVRGAAHH